LLWWWWGSWRESSAVRRYRSDIALQLVAARPEISTGRALRGSNGATEGRFASGEVATNAENLRKQLGLANMAKQQPEIVVLVASSKEM